jgi:ribonuclease Z
MKLTFLGTSAGKPTKERGLSALALEFDQDNKWYLFDCGEATQFQLLHSRLSIGKLDTIFITHLHGDHFYGLAGLLSSKKMDEALKPLTLYGPKGIKRFLDCTFETSKSDLGYELKVIEYKIHDEFIFDKFKVKVLPLIHSMDSVAFYIKENDITNRLDEEKLRSIGLEPSPIYGKLKQGKSIMHNGQMIEPKEYMLDVIEGRKIIIAGDNKKPDILGEYLENLDLLVHECTYTQEVYDSLKKRFLHTTAKDLGVACSKFRVKNLIATHISPRYHDDGRYPVRLIEDEIKESFHRKAFVANDFDEFYLQRDGKITRSISNQKVC